MSITVTFNPSKELSGYHLMNQIGKKIIEEFGNKLRVRVCGICINGDSMLLVNHHSLNQDNDFWAPPGGGMDFGQSAEENLKREFLEETGLRIDVEKFLCVHEYLKTPLHAIELFFKVKAAGGSLVKGLDPELKRSEQIIRDVRYISMKKIKDMPADCVHQMLRHLEDIESIDSINGYFRYNE